MPLPGELSAWTTRYCANNVAPTFQTLPLAHGEWIVVITYEHSWEDSTDEPLRLRYGFASLDASGKTKVLTVADFLKAQGSRYESAEIEANVSVWKQRRLRCCESSVASKGIRPEC